MDEARLQTAKSEQPKYQRTDARWKEIREELARRSRKKQEEDLVEEFYVDSYRSGHFCLPPEGQEEVNLLVLVVVLGIISFFFHI